MKMPDKKSYILPYSILEEYLKKAFPKRGEKS